MRDWAANHAGDHKAPNSEEMIETVKRSFAKTKKRILLKKQIIKIIHQLILSTQTKTNTYMA